MTRKTLEIADYVEITIRRPGGEIEMVRHPSLPALNDAAFARIAEATKAAGRGEALSYQNFTKEILESDEVYAARLKGEADDRAYYAYKAGHDAVVAMSAMGEDAS